MAECNSCGNEYDAGTEGSDFGLCPKCYAEIKAQTDEKASNTTGEKTKPETIKLTPKEWRVGILFLLGIAAIIGFFVFVFYASTDEKIADLTDADSGVRQSAAISLGASGEERAVDALIAALQTDKDSEVRKSAAGALGGIGDVRAMEPLLAALQGDEDVGVRQKAAIALANIGDKSAIEPLKTALREDGSPYVRQSAVQALYAFGTAQALEPILSALKDEDSNVRMQAAHALAKMDDARAVQGLNAALGEGDAAVAAGAYEFFIQQGKEGSEDLLIAALNQYGGTTMANQYLNSGNPLLESAAREWADAHGYDIEPFYGKMDSNNWGGN